MPTLLPDEHLSAPGIVALLNLYTANLWRIAQKMCTFKSCELLLLAALSNAIAYASAADGAMMLKRHIRARHRTAMPASVG